MHAVVMMLRRALLAWLGALLAAPALAQFRPNGIGQAGFSGAAGGGGGGGNLGPELVLNGDFASSAGWTLTNGASIAGGQLLMDGASGSAVGRAIRAANGVLVAANYQYAFDLVATDGVSPVQVVIGDNGFGFAVPGSTSPGAFQGTAPGLADNQNIALVCPDTALTIDNFSVKQILP